MKIPKVHHDVSSYALMGGEDLVTSAIEVNPGRLSYSQNYECNPNGRYRMIDGYEAFDGQSSPSDEIEEADIEIARALIAEVPGSGNVIGVHQYKGVKYAFRNNAGGTACAMYKSSAAGWVLCDLGRSLPFTSGGTYVIAEDDEIAGEIGVATATVKRVVITSGSLAGGDAAGVLILYDQVGDFEAETIRVGVNANVATITGNSTENTLTADGRFEFENYNFYGHSDYFRMYGVDGVSPGFEWDGSTFVPILTGMTTDTPNHIAVHKKHLFFSFPGGSLQHSGIGTPYIWTPVTGASEIGIGDDITRLSVNVGILAIFSRNSTHLLYGTSIDDWELKDHSLESGCIEWSAQTIGTEVYLDDRGLTTLQATDKYGDFVGNVISVDVQPYLKTMLGNVQSSIRVKDKGQYRLYFDNMEGLCLTMDKNKVVGFTRFFYDKLPVCCCSAENSSGEEELFFGSTDGFVYQLDKGTSFNGNEIESLLRLHYNHLKTPFNEKQIRQLILEGEFPIGTEISFYMDFSYGDDAESEEVDLDVVEAGGIWGVADWDAFVWDGPTVGLARAYPGGCGINFALMLSSTSTYVPPHTLNALSVHYSIRGLRR